MNNGNAVNVPDGDPSLEIYIKEDELSAVKSKEPKCYCLKLMEFVFSREEAKMSSVKGSGKRPDGQALKKLDG